jgi:hypothetical protein
MPRKKKDHELSTLEQWVEVTVEDGRTVTALYPANKLLAEEADSMSTKPDLVYRRINFVNGVPSEYRWTNPSDSLRRFGGMGIQRMRFETWRRAVRTEQAQGTGHLGPVEGGNLPRPTARGGCDCETCRLNAALLIEETD